MAATLFLAALAVRAAFIPFHGFSAERTFSPDSPLYLELATNLSQSGQFRRGAASAAASPENPESVEAFRTPGYPWFLALFDRLGIPMVAAGIAVQIVLDAVIAVLTWLLARRLVPDAIAVGAGALVAVDPGHVVYANMVMSDVLFAFLLASAFFFAMRVRAEGGLTALLGSGLALAAAGAVRPVGALVFVPVTAYLLLRGVNRRRVLALVALAVSFPAAWTLRNGMAVGYWGTSTAFDYNLALLAAPKVIAGVEGISRAEAQRRLIQAAERADPGATIAGRAAAFRRVGLAALGAHPRRSLREGALSAAEFAVAGERRYPLRLLGFLAGADGVAGLGEGSRGAAGVVAFATNRGLAELALVGVQIVWNGLVLVAAAGGCIALARRRQFAELLLLGATVIYIGAASLVVATARMRLPVTFALAVLAACGVAAWHSRRVSVRSDQARAVIGVRATM